MLDQLSVGGVVRCGMLMFERGGVGVSALGVCGVFVKWQVVVACPAMTTRVRCAHTTSPRPVSLRLLRARLLVCAAVSSVASLGSEPPSFQKGGSNGGFMALAAEKGCAAEVMRLVVRAPLFWRWR